MAHELTDVLLSAGLISESDLQEARRHLRGREIGIGQALVDLGRIDSGQLARAQAKSTGLPFIDLTKGRVSAELVALVPEEFALEQGVLPVLEKNGRLIVAVDDPLKKIIAEQLQFQLGRDVGVALAEPAALKAALAAAYGAPAPEVAAVGATEEESDAPIVRLVSRTFSDALKMRASDIHLEPSEQGLRVRFRIDGVLRIVAEHPKHLAAPLVSRLKVMGSMDIAERRKPQDGRIELEIDGRHIDVRASILPSNHGETVVMRLLDRSASLIGLAELGFGKADQAWFSKLISRPHGIVLVTGPTGSGKTTTLYAALNELNRSDVKIITAEDPVEYHISGLNQVQVHPRIGLTFARILKAMLRAAPNVILVGEIRDVETAEVAIQAALTGHLVFSTLHTNDAPSALTRLVDMGVQPFLASAAVQGVVAQRLVRRLCYECAVPAELNPAELAGLGLTGTLPANARILGPGGCSRCEGSGYRGRLGLFELLEMDAELRDLVFSNSSLENFARMAERSGRLRTLRVDGAAKVLAGQTSAAEVLRVVRAAGGERAALASGS